MLSLVPSQVCLEGDVEPCKAQCSHSRVKQIRQSSLSREQNLPLHDAGIAQCTMSIPALLPLASISSLNAVQEALDFPSVLTDVPDAPTSQQ